MEEVTKAFQKFEERFCGQIPGLYDADAVHVYRVAGGWLANSDQEINVEPSELVQVVSYRRSSSDGYWIIMLRNRVGLIPKDRLERIAESDIHRLAVVVAASTSNAKAQYDPGDLLEIIKEPLVGNHVVSLLRGKEVVIEAESVDWFVAHNFQSFLGEYISCSLSDVQKIEKVVEQLEQMNVMVVIDSSQPKVANSAHRDDEITTIPPPPDVAPPAVPQCTGENDASPIECVSPTTASVSEIPFDELEMLDCIGRGGFSHVWKARRRDTSVNEEIVAVKKLILTVDQDDDMIREALYAEALVNAGLMHKNIVMFRGVCVTPPNFAIVMEFVDDGTLFDKVKSTLEPTALTSYARQVASGMSYLHEDAPITIIHRDLKSLNVLVSSSKICKITDFGMARKHVHTTRMSGAGTAAWMAPEVIRSGTYTKGADVWAYGVVLWEMLTGQIPYDGVEQMAVAYGVGRGKLTLPVPKECPAVLGQLMNQCWAAKPHDRPPFHQIVTALRSGALSTFEAKPRHSLILQQREWGESLPADIEQRRLEAERRAALLDEREQVLSRQAEDQAAREAALSERERTLKQTEMQLRLQQMLLDDQKAASPVRGARGHARKPSWPQKIDTNEEQERKSSRAKRTTSKRLTKRDISTPKDFRHVNHISPSGGGPVSVGTSGGTDSIPVQTVPVEVAAAAANAHSSISTATASSAVEEETDVAPHMADLPQLPKSQRIFRVTSRDVIVPPPLDHPPEPDRVTIPPPEMFAPPPPQFGD